MRFVCPYVEGMLRHETEVALRAHARDLIEWRLLPADDVSAYGKLIAELWESGDSFAIIEQDIRVRADIVDGFLSCPEPYCAYPYSWMTDVGPALGCTRFRAELTRDYPTAAEEAVLKNVGWQQFDVILMRHVLVRRYGLQPHVHLPVVEHLNEAKALLPDANPNPLTSLPAW